MTTAILLFILTGVFQINGLTTVFIGLILTSIAYIGDVFILPNITHITAAITDYLLIVFMIWLLGSFLITPTNIILPAAIISGIFVMIGELLFHQYMKKQIVGDHEPKNISQSHKLQTEFSEDF